MRRRGGGGDGGERGDGRRPDAFEGLFEDPVLGVCEQGTVVMRKWEQYGEWELEGGKEELGFEEEGRRTYIRARDTAMMISVTRGGCQPRDRKYCMCEGLENGYSATRSKVG